MPSFINKQTTLDLNGPVLSFVQHPDPASSCTSGIATFVGLATATFPTQDPANPATGTGYISYNWYLNDEALVDGDLNGTTVAGAATTTLTLTGISSAILLNGSRIFLRADYVPSAYSQPDGSDVNAGTARSTGNAINDPIDSDAAILSVSPDIIITQQPQVVGITTTQNLSDFSSNSILRLSLSDENTGSLVLRDLSFVENTVANTNVTLSSTGGFISKTYASFGTNSFLTITPSSDFAFGTGDFTVETWVYFTETGWKDIFSTGTYGQGQLSIRKNRNSQLTSSPGAEQLEVYFNTTIIASGGQFSLNTWHHVAVSRGGGFVRLFIDGTQVSSSAFSNSIVATDVKIGRTPGNVYNMVGGMQQFEVYNVAKYTSNFTPPGIAFTNNNKSPRVAQNSSVEFIVEASTTDPSQGDVEYQWQLNEVDLIDGDNTISVPKNNQDYPFNALLRLPLWDKNSETLVLEDLTNVANTVTNNGVTWVDGSGGKFYDGYANFTSSSFVDLKPLSDFNFGTGDFTVETWVYFTETGFNDIFSTGTYGQDQLSIRKNEYSQLGSSPGAEQLEAYYNGTIIASGGQFSLNTWHHVAITRTTPETASKQDSTLRLFIDGTQVASSVFNSNIKATDVKIGRTPGNIYNMVGKMQDFQVYANSLYTSNFIPSTVAIVDKRLVLSLPLWDNGTGQLSLTDLSANQKTITPGLTWGRSPSWVPGVGKFYGGAAHFDGKSYLNVPGSTDFNFGTGDFTVECWVNFQNGTSQAGPWEVLVNVGGGYYSAGGIWFALLRSGSGATFYIANVSGYASIGYVDDIKVGTWRHLAVSKEGTNVRFFFDGQYVGQRVDSSAYGGNDLGYIGLENAVFHTQGYYNLIAYLQDINIYKGVAKYTSNFIPTSTSIVSGQSDRVEVNTFVSGSKTPNLTLALPNVSSNLVRAKISHPTACNSPIYTNTAQIDVVPPTSRAVIEVEVYEPNSTTATLREFDLTDLDYIVTSDDFDSDTICFYAKDRDITVEFEMFGAKGSDLKVYFGGEGGYSKIRFTMKRGDEYILKGIKTKTALYLYRKAQLIACVGQGGFAGTNGNGGRGGGIGVSGENGFGKNSGNGGIAIASGTMSGNGIFGSSSGATSIYSEDSKSTGVTGGRTISCTKGVYWREQGRTACSDLGTIKFRLADGREVSNSVAISRGFKDGYSINQTSGNSQFTGGIGGNGATGGDGGVNGGGGGGGSGYTDGSVTVVDATLGGHNVAETKLIMRLFETVGDFYIDSAGRILIFSAATIGKDPRTFTKTTGRVLPGTDSCIDDARWQNFLDLAETQDYRLTATLDGGRTGVTEARPFNIRRMKRANSIPLKRSLTDWENTNYAYLLLALAWDETNIGGARGYGSDYSIFSMAPGTYYYGYYGASSNSFFNEAAGSVYGYRTANYWILPPGVPDFPR